MGEGGVTDRPRPTLRPQSSVFDHCAAHLVPQTGTGTVSGTLIWDGKCCGPLGDVIHGHEDLAVPCVLPYLFFSLSRDELLAIIAQHLAMNVRMTDAAWGQ